MRIEIILFLIAAFIIANIYTDGKYLRLMASWKKYYQMIGVAVGAFVLYWLIKRNPGQANQIIMGSNEYLKYLPVDRNTADMISPILDFTAKQNFYGAQDGGYNHPTIPVLQNHSTNSRQQAVSEQKLMNSGKRPTKRSVSETKKKFVAARQNWCCGGCNKQLTAWFEVDHKTRLEYGGSNHVDNLVALCRECHGEKTTMENL
jgi:hypothetical protein